MKRNVEIDGPAMSEVISFREARYPHARQRRPSPKMFGAKAETTADRRVDEIASSDAGQPSISGEDVRHAILLLDIAAQHVRFLVKEIADPSRRENFEAQIAAIEQSLQHARRMASNL